MSKPTTVQIYITSGALGRHAGVYSNDRCWAAHPTDDATAAWRAAVKFWFGKGQNSAWVYKNVARVSVVKNTDLTWQATLADQDAAARETKTEKTKRLWKRMESKRAAQKARKK
jgi:hypothetical protein